MRSKKDGVSHLDYETVRRLKQTKFSIEERAKELFTDKEFKALRIDKVATQEAISKQSSFAVWLKPPMLTRWEGWSQIRMDAAMRNTYGYTRKRDIARDIMDNTRKYLQDWRGYEDGNRDSQLRSDIVMLGVNTGSGADRSRNNLPPVIWENFGIFHDNLTGKDTGDQPSKVTEYFVGLDDKVFTGAYMTDVVKGLPTEDGSKLIAEVHTRAENLGVDPKLYLAKFYKLFAKVLEDELAIVGVPKVFILMGSSPVINRVLDSSDELKNIPRVGVYHFTARTSGAAKAESLQQADAYIRGMGIV